MKQVLSASNTTLGVSRKGEVVYDSERGSTALFKQLQREVSGEIEASKRQKIDNEARSAAKKRSSQAKQYKL